MCVTKKLMVTTKKEINNIQVWKYLSLTTVRDIPCIIITKLIYISNNAYIVINLHQL